LCSFELDTSADYARAAAAHAARIGLTCGAPGHIVTRVTISDVTNSGFLARFESGIARVHALHPDMPRDAVVRVRLLYHTLRILSEGLETFFSSQGISSVGWSVLMMTYASPGQRVNPSTLSDSLGQSRTHMTRATDELVAKGYLARTVAADDRRRIDLQLTPQGRRFIGQVLPRAWAQYSSCLEVFSDAEARTFERLLRKLLAHLNAGTQGASIAAGARVPEGAAAARKGQKA
jgi:MarR family transcriptional repressor of emrRAB